MKLKMQDGTDFELPTKVKQAGRLLADVFANSGRIDEDTRVPWENMVDMLVPTRDATSTPDLHPILSVSTQVLIREPVEPMMVIAGLFTKIAVKGLQQNVLLGAMGAVQADDMAEGEEAPEVMFNIGGGMQTVMIGKAGIQASFTKEALRYSTWDVWSMNMREMGKALARLKEHKAVQMLRNLGTELYNNSSPATSIFGVTTGRGIDMTANGSLRMDDLMKAMAHMAEEGFMPDTILINPQFFYLYVSDPILRTIMMNVGNMDYFRQWSGQPGPQDPWSNGAMGAMGPSLGNVITRGGSPSGGVATGIAGREHGMTSAPPFPAPYFPWSMRVIVSPSIPFDAESEVGDMYLIQSGSVGYLLQDEEPVETTWEDYSRDILKVKIIERYSFAIAHQGQGVGVLKNIKLAPNYFTGVVQATTMDADSEIAADATIDL